MFTHDNNNDKQKYCCWISEKDRVLSFHYIEGYDIQEFDTFKEFQDYYYKKTYWGFLVE